MFILLDNFYLDMNGIIHNCAKNSQGTRMNEAEVFAAIFDYVQVLFQKIRPKKIMFLAIDGALLFLNFRRRAAGKDESATQPPI